jgi:Gluconate 2-dehydrogenase subunit 3
MSRIARRDALRSLAAGGVGAAASALWVDRLGAFAREQAVHAHAAIATAAQSSVAWKPKTFSQHQLDTVVTLSELIIPQTDTPGAKATQVDRFIDTVLAESPAADRASFLKGLGWIDARSKVLFGKDLLSSTVEQQTELLSKLSTPNSREERAGVDFFNAIKSLTITGYYTTEVGLRQELGDDGVLAQATFEGCTHAEHRSE